jgi:hypothetical protein
MSNFIEIDGQYIRKESIYKVSDVSPEGGIGGNYTFSVHFQSVIFPRFKTQGEAVRTRNAIMWELEREDVDNG